MLARSIGGPGGCLSWAMGARLKCQATGTHLPAVPAVCGSVRRRIAAGYTLNHTRMHPQSPANYNGLILALDIWKTPLGMAKFGAWTVTERARCPPIS